MTQANVSRESLLAMRQELSVFGKDAEIVTSGMLANLSEAIDEAECHLDCQIRLVNELREELGRLRKENAKLHSDLSHANKRMNQAQRRDSELRHKLQNASEKCGRIRGEVYRAETSGDTELAARYKAELREAQARYKELSGLQMQNKGEIERTGKEIYGLKNSIERKEQEVRGASNRCEWEENRLVEMRACFQRLQEDAHSLFGCLTDFQSYALGKNESNLSTIEQCIDFIDEYDRVQLS